MQFLLQKKSNNTAAKKFPIERKRIREWRKTKSKLFDSAVKDLEEV